MSRSRKRSSRYRNLRVLILFLIGVGCVIGGVLWQQEAPLRRVQQLLAEGRPEDAIQEIRAWEREHRPTGRSQALLARGLVDTGHFQSAIRIFETVAAAEPEELHAWAKAYLSVHQWSNALPLLKQLRNLDRDTPDVLHELAACQAKLGKLTEALETATEFRKYDEFAHRALLLIGSINLQLDNKTAAIEAWQQIADYDPEFDDLQLPAAEFLTQFASLHIELGQVDEASQLLSKALSIQETAEGLYQAGLAADLSGDQQTAKLRWQRAVEMDPMHRNARESLARFAISTGATDEAAAILKPILKDGTNRSSTTYLMQRIAQIQGDREQGEVWKLKTEQLRNREAIDSAVNQILTENPNSYWSQVVRSYQFAERGNYQQAQQLLDRIETNQETSFVTDLRNAVRTRRSLPDKDRIPIQQF